MIGLIETNSYPNVRCVLFSGTSIFGSIPGYNFLPLEEQVITCSSSNNHDRIKAVLQAGLAHVDMTALVEVEIINKVADMLASVDVAFSIIGLSKQGRFFFGTPSAYYIHFPELNDLKVYLNGSAPIAYKDTIDYVVGLTVQLTPLTVHDKRTASGVVDINLPSNSTQGKFLEAITPFTQINVVANTADGKIIIDGYLRHGGRLNEKESIIYIDTLNDLVEVYRLADEAEVQIIIDSKRNEIVRSSMDLHRDVIAFGNTLLDKLGHISASDVTLVSGSSATIKAVRTFNSATQGWSNVLSQNVLSYAMLKDCLERNLALSDSLGSVYSKRVSDWLEKIKDSLLTKQVGNLYLTMGTLAESNVKFELADGTISLNKEAIRKAISLENAINSINSNRVEVLNRATRYKNEVQLEYSKLIANLNIAYNEYSKALNNEKLSSAAAKVYLDQLNAIENLEVRSWWNNALMGTVRSFISQYTDDGSKLIPSFDKERLKICYKQVSSNCEYKWESCDYWIIERSGSPEHSYFGKPDVSSERIRDDWRSNESTYPLTIPASSLQNLQLTYNLEAPQTATWQYYTDCGKRKTVIEPVSQVARPKLGVDEFINKFTATLSALQQKYYQFAKLVEETREIRGSILKTIKSLEIRKGELEAKSFSAQNLESYALFLEQQLSYYRTLSIDSDAMQGQLAFGQIAGSEDAATYPGIIAVALEQFLTAEDINYVDCIVMKDTTTSAVEEGESNVDIAKTLVKVKEKLKTFKPKLYYAGTLIENDTVVVDKYTVKLKIEHELDESNLNLRLRVEVEGYEITQSPAWTGKFNGYSWSKSDILLFCQLAKDVFSEDDFNTYIKKPLIHELNLTDIQFDEELLNFRSDYLALCKMKSVSFLSKVSYLLLNNRQLTPVDYLVDLASNRNSILLDYNQAVACFFGNYIEEVAYVN